MLALKKKKKDQPKSQSASPESKKQKRIEEVNLNVDYVFFWSLFMYFTLLMILLMILFQGIRDVPEIDKRVWQSIGPCKKIVFKMESVEGLQEVFNEFEFSSNSNTGQD